MFWVRSLAFNALQPIARFAAVFNSLLLPVHYDSHVHFSSSYSMY